MSDNKTGKGNPSPSKPPLPPKPSPPPKPSLPPKPIAERNTRDVPPAQYNPPIKPPKQ